MTLAFCTILVVLTIGACTVSFLFALRRVTDELVRELRNLADAVEAPMEFGCSVTPPTEASGYSPVQPGQIHGASRKIRSF